MPTEKTPNPSNNPTEESPKLVINVTKRPIFKIILIIVAAVAVLITMLAIFRNSNQPKTTTPAVSHLQKTQVMISKSGFQPVTLQVKAGTQVTWTNADTAKHQVAADPYPKDNSIAGFDSSIILNYKDTYSFTFNKAGTYTYHDERNPIKFKGTIVVQ